PGLQETLRAVRLRVMPCPSRDREGAGATAPSRSRLGRSLLLLLLDGLLDRLDEVRALLFGGEPGGVGGGIFLLGIGIGRHRLMRVVEDAPDHALAHHLGGASARLGLGLGLGGLGRRLLLFRLLFFLVFFLVLAFAAFLLAFRRLVPFFLVFVFFLL